MSEQYRVEWSDEALDDLALRLDFLAHRNPSAAERAGELIISAAEKLAAFPHSGRPYGHGGLGERECLVPFLDSSATRSDIALMERSS